MNRLLFFVMLLLWSITSFAKTCTVTSEILYLRESAGTEQKIILTLNKGDEVEVLQDKPEKGWIKVRFNSHIGFVASGNLSCYASAKTQTKKQASNGVWVCMGKSAVAYHNQSSCKGLAKCKADIITVKESEAKGSYGRRPCKLCYN